MTDRPLLSLDAEGRVRLGDRPAPVTPYAHRLLALLVQRAGQVVTVREAAEHLWPGGVRAVRAVSPAAHRVTAYVSMIRRAIGDDARQPVYIERTALGYRLRPETVAGRGPG